MSLGKHEICPKCGERQVLVSLSRKKCKSCGWELRAEYDNRGIDNPIDFQDLKARVNL